MTQEMSCAEASGRGGRNVVRTSEQIGEEKRNKLQ